MHPVLVMLIIGYVVVIGEAGYTTSECLADQNKTFCCQVQLVRKEEVKNNRNSTCVMRDYAIKYCNLSN